MALAVVKINRARLAELEQFSINDFPSARVAPAHDFLPIHPACADLTARPKDGCLAVVRDEEVQRSVAVQVRERNRSAAERFGVESRYRGAIREMPVAFVEKQNEVNTDGVEPLTTMSYEINVMREDQVKEHLSHERALLNAPKKDDDYFRVPKVLE